MKFLVVSDAPILKRGLYWEAYAPYVNEMDLWMKNATQTIFICPIKYEHKLLTKPFVDQNLNIKSLRRLEFHTNVSALISIFAIPYQALLLWNEMRRADHIHLRCPGNLALLACFVQILFPKKKKTAKYAGNWDPASKQPFAYRMQKWLLSNTFLTKNIKVLVYGEWSDQSKNIKPFFTASYSDSEKVNIRSKDFSQPLKVVFVGTMGANKRPLETVQLIHTLRKMGMNITLEMYGDGPERTEIEVYCKENGIENYILLKGNQSSEVVKESYKKAHILILLSQSEGWPKVIAEAMFWGVVPIVSMVSCIPWMLANGKRGFLIKDPSSIDINELNELKELLEDSQMLEGMSIQGMQWSRQYTMDAFSVEIEKLLA